MKKYLLILLILLINSEIYTQTYNDISILSVRNLVFGSIIPGITTSIATTSSGAGRYVIRMSRNMTVSLTFNLPANLTYGNNNLPINYIATSGTNSNDATLSTSFDPYTGTTIQRTAGNTKDWYIRVGGSIPTPSTQAAGAYSGTIIMTMTIIGG